MEQQIVKMDDVVMLQQILATLEKIQQHHLSNDEFISIMQKDINIVASLVKKLISCGPDEVNATISAMNSLTGTFRWSEDFKKGLVLVLALLAQIPQFDSVKLNAIQFALTKSVLEVPIQIDLSSPIVEKMELTEPITIGFVIYNAEWCPDHFLRERTLDSRREKNARSSAKGYLTLRPLCASDEVRSVLNYSENGIFPVIAHHWLLKQEGYLSKGEQIELVKYLEKYPSGALWLTRIASDAGFKNFLFVKDLAILGSFGTNLEVTVDASLAKKAVFVKKTKYAFCETCFSVYDKRHGASDCVKFLHGDKW